MYKGYQDTSWLQMKNHDNSTASLQYSDWMGRRKVGRKTVTWCVIKRCGKQLCFIERWAAHTNLFELLHTCCCLDVLLVHGWALRVINNSTEVVEQSLEGLEVFKKLWWRWRRRWIGVLVIRGCKIKEKRFDRGCWGTLPYLHEVLGT